ncbi:MAG: hypothetical protein VB099_14430 [Candidatus Limiplasma sp.]|nr:hypothetical protein [Candidatus Limiplasma sp.]
MNPFDQKNSRLEDCILDWKGLYPAPYNKNEVAPYTRTRIILMNGTEFENVWFSHQFSRNCGNNDVRRQLALLRRLEQQQQKLLSALKPVDETVLEHTIGYEQLAVDLTAHLAQREADPYVKTALDFALLEDFDHLYRYADLMDMETGVHAEDLVGHYTEVTPGRPTISEHCFPYDTIKKSIRNNTAALSTKLCVGIITAAEQQTMNFYMNVCGTYKDDRGRKLYQEIGMIEEQHVTHYGSLMDPSATWLENLLMHQYIECYLYYSCMETESCPKTKQVWQWLYDQETIHLAAAAKLLKKEEGKDYQQVVGNGDFPDPICLCSNIEYVRQVLGKTVQETTCRESYASVDHLAQDADFFRYQQKVNPDAACVPSHMVIKDHINQFGRDYRWESAPNPITQLRDVRVDNIDVGRVPGSVQPPPPPMMAGQAARPQPGI